MPINPCIDDPYAEWQDPNIAEDPTNDYLGSAIYDQFCLWIIQWDLSGNPPTPPPPKKIKAPPQPPPVGHPTPPRVRRPKLPPFPY